MYSVSTVSLNLTAASSHSEPFMDKNLSKSFSPLQLPQVLSWKVPPQQGLVIACGLPGVSRAGGWG